MTAITLPDIVVVVLIAGSFLRSFFRGAIRELFSLAALAAGIFAAVIYGGTVGNLAASWLGGVSLPARVVDAAVFLIVWIIVNLAGRLAAHMFESTGPSIWVRLFGGLIGAAKGLLFVAALVAGIEALAPGYLPPSGKMDRVMPHVRRLSGYLRSLNVEGIEKRMKALKKEPKEKNKEAGSRPSAP